ncbi:uncharacterized protein LOC134330491 [Trichomycterus rosablanca]|uniref:uncharacterized protein LOC134330491 n=1 Tax=Trichomycterus rosablanca TaxID=2290929 RepID=UPI002F35F3FF
MEEVEVFLGLFLVFLYVYVQQSRLKRSNEAIRRRRVRSEREERAYLRALTQYTLYRRARALKLFRVLQSIRRPPVAWTRRRSTDWWDRCVPRFSLSQWLENFRMSEQTYLHLCNRLRPAMEKEDTQFRCCVPHRKRVAIALWKLGTNAEYRTISRLFGVGITTVWRCTKEFCIAVADVLQREVIAVPSAQGFAELAEEFERTWGVPQCVGTIGRVHIPITVPREYQDEYINQSGWHSVLLQAVVGGRAWFWDVSAGRPGGLDDASALRLSPLWRLMNSAEMFPSQSRTIGGEEVGYFIIGDASYPAQSWLVTPFTDADGGGGLSEQQLIFNARISGVKGAVDTAFSRLRGRWRCLLKRNNCDVEFATQMVVACCVLHNLCEGRGEEYVSDWSDAPVPDQPEAEPAALETSDTSRVRDGLARHFCHSSEFK